MCKRLLFFVFFGEKIPFRPRRTGLKRPDGARLFGDGRFEAGASACGRRFRSGRCLWCPGSFGAFRSPDRGRVRTISRRRRSLAGPFIRRFVRGLRPARSRRRGSCGLFRISVRVLFHIGRRRTVRPAVRLCVWLGRLGFMRVRPFGVPGFPIGGRPVVLTGRARRAFRLGKNLEYLHRIGMLLDDRYGFAYEFFNIL